MSKKNKQKKTPVTVTTAGTTAWLDDLKIPKDLHDRARKVGVSDEQMMNLGNAEAVKQFCDQISPTTNPDAFPKADVVIPRKTSPIPGWADAVPASFGVANDDLKAEKDSIERIVRKLNIKHNNPKLKRIKKTVVYDCQSKKVIFANYEVEQ
jgi:hypothetical protein